jgi:DNA repair exonuclease SbcCD ATPase subunit
MRLNTLEIKGFSSYKDYAKVNIPLGITGIVGNIEDIEGRSNAAGKTSLLMSFLFSLYGVGTFDRMEEVWNDKLAPTDDAFVKSDFDLMGNNYVVERGRKKKASYLDVFENGKRVCEGNTESQEFLQSLIGMDSKMFLSSVFVAQKDLAAFIDTDPGIRKSYMDVVTDLGLWRSASKRSASIYRENKNSFDTLLEEVKTVDKTIAENETIIRSLTSELQNIDSIKKKRDEKVVEVSKLLNIKNIRDTLNEYESLKKKGIQEITNLTLKQETTETSLKEAASSISELKEEFSSFENFDSTKLQSDLDTLSKQLDVASFQEAESTKRSQVVIQNIAYNSAELKLLGKDRISISEGTCDRCKQPVSKEHIEKLCTEVDEKKESLIKAGETLQKDKDSVQQEIDSFSAEVYYLQETIKNTKYTLDRYVDMHTRMEDAEAAYTKLNNSLVLDLKNINTSLLSTQISIAEYDTKITDLQQQISENVHIDVNLLNQELDALNRTLEDLTIKQGRLQKFEEDVVTQKNVLTDKKKRLKKLQESLYYLEVLGEAFKDIPAELFKESVVDVENYANEIIRSIYHKFKIKIYEDETKKNRPLMIAFEVDGKYRNYKLLSGGQQSICALGLRMGFNRILSQRSRVSLNFLILDEIFGSLDKFNRDEVLRMLNGLTKFFPQILVITHTEEDNIFPNLIKVRMDSAGNSSII